MTTKKFTIYVCASLREWAMGELTITDYDPTPHPDFKMELVSTHEIELDVPEFDIRNQAVVSLEAEIQKERADSQVRLNLLMERISKLQAIGNDGCDA